MERPRVLVTDFDGTITAVDFFYLAVERFMDKTALAPWKDYEAGKISHFTAVQRIFAKIRAPESEVLALLKETRPDPLLPACAKALREDGWQVVVASAGCEWYVRHILDSLNISHFEVHANPGYYQEGGPLVMEAPVASPFYDPETGVDKAGIVRFYLEQGAEVFFAGDGLPDVPAGLLVPPSRRFARKYMAAELKRRGEAFHAFSVWSDVARSLLGRDISARDTP